MVNIGPSLAITERAFQTHVIRVARLYSWHHYYVFDSRRSNPGWPDLVFWKPKRLIFAELKTQSGRVSEAQTRVIGELRAAGQQVYLWRPADWDLIVGVLSGRKGV